MGSLNFAFLFVSQSFDWFQVGSAVRWIDPKEKTNRS